MSKILHIYILLLFIPGFPFSQQFFHAKNNSCGKITDGFISAAGNTVVARDSISARGTLAIKDTLAVKDTLAAVDTLSAKRKSDIDAVVVASSTDSISFDVSAKKMYVYGKSNLKYKKTELNSATIAVDFQANELSAKGAPDSTGKKIVNTPVLNESGEVYEGSVIRYNFKTQRGNISLARNEAEGTVYTGEKVRKVDKSTYFIKNGTYTTCTAETSHYHFYAKEMKVIMQEQIIAKWIWLYIGGVPLPVPLPFGAFPNKTGRRSGFIVPAYGSNYLYGPNLSHFGYFWAVNDYMDVNALADYYFKGGYSLSSNYRYALRYKLNGSVSAGYSKRHIGESTDPDYSESSEWKLDIAHHHTIDPTLKLDAGLHFMSSNYYRDVSQNYSYSDILSRNITSSASLFKSWDESGNSLSLSYSRNQNLSSGNIEEVLPSASFNMSQSYPFKRKNSSYDNQKWYELFNIGYSAQAQNNRSKTEGKLNSRAGASHNLNAGFSPKIGYFSISPSITYQERWYNKHSRIESHLVDDTTITVDGNDTTQKVTQNEVLTYNDVKSLDFVRTFNFSLGASTKLYGILQPNALGIEAFRHTMTPRISYNYSPDFSSDKWGYYDTYISSKTGKLVRYDKYQREPYGGVSAYEQQNIALSVDNLFEIKTKKDPNDTTSQQKKIQLLNLSGYIAYNFAAPRNRLSDLNLNFRTQAGQWLNFSGNAVYSFYQWKDGELTNRLLWNKDKSLVRLRYFNFNMSTSLSGEKLKGKSENQLRQNEDEEAYQTPADQNQTYTGLYKEELPDFSIPWDLSLGFNYSDNLESKVNNKVAGLTASFNFSLTQSLKIYFNGSYDIIEKKLAAPQIRIYKDLHCWEMNFDWRPMGFYRGYRFEIRIKASQLQDIKLERQRRYY
ncbi:MAG: putative LPS assembly protein LptD [Bacteroidota bacterium]